MVSSHLMSQHVCGRILTSHRLFCLQAAVHAQEKEMGVTEEQAYAPIRYGRGSTVDFQDKTLLNLTLARESTAVASFLF